MGEYGTPEDIVIERISPGARGEGINRLKRGATNHTAATVSGRVDPVLDVNAA